jgi:uncharacterized membrane protein (DUF485 family)
MSNSNEAEQRRAIAANVRQRFIFTGVFLLLYSTVIALYTDAGSWLNQPLFSDHISGAIWLIAGLIVIFIAMEKLFLSLRK